MTSYADAMKRHLAAYKRDRLRVLEHGIWENNGKEYEHILPKSLHRLNILESARDAFWAYYDAHRTELGLHKDFHHLNSSQAFAFNLFFPYFVMGGDGHELLAAIGAPVEPVAAWRFEHMPDQAEGTAVDFFVEYVSGQRLLVEVKLTETSFGTAVSNAGREAKRREYYAPRLRGRVADALLESEAFFLKYQLLRNVSHLRLDEGDQLVLLVPRANETAWAEAVAFVADDLLGPVRGAVRVVAVEDVIAGLNASAAPGGHLGALSEKYMIAPA